MASVSNQKRQYILQGAKQVFLRKGYAGVTMADIIEECGISRGGIYLYFSSVKEIFQQVILQHNQSKLLETRDYVSKHPTFMQALDDYLQRQKQRLLSMENSLLISMYEYRFAHKDSVELDFFRQQFAQVKTIILEILNFGVAEGALSVKNTDALADHVVYFIEGLSMLGTAVGLTEGEIDTQLAQLKAIILTFDTGATTCP